MSELVGQETGRRWVEALYRENYEVVRRLARSLLTGNLKSMAEDVAQDLEGLQIMRTLAKNMAWMLKSFEAGRAAGVNPPEPEAPVRTNFIR